MKASKFDIKRTSSWAGSLLMIVSLVFIGRRIFLTHGDVDFGVFADPWVLIALLAVAFFEGMGILLAGVNYRALVANVSGIKVKAPLALVVYTLSNLYKYIPGGIMYVLGRNKMAIDTDELTHTKVALSTLIEGVFIAVAAIFVAAAFSFEHSVYYLRQAGALPIIGLVVVVIVSAAIPIVYYKRKKLLVLLNDMKNDTADLRLAVIFRRLLCALALMVMFAFSFIAVLLLLGQELTFGMGVTVMGLYMLSWLAGFITPGAPSGLGVREAVMLMFMGSTLNEGVLISAMVMHRMLTVTGDVSAYGMALFFSRGRHHAPLGQKTVVKDA